MRDFTKLKDSPKFSIRYANFFIVEICQTRFEPSYFIEISTLPNSKENKVQQREREHRRIDRMPRDVS